MSDVAETSKVGGVLAVPLALIFFLTGATAVNLWVLHVPALAGLTAVLMVLALAPAWLRRPQKG